MNSFHNKFAEFIFQIYSFISYRPTRTAAGEGERGSVRRITRLYTHDFGGGGDDFDTERCGRKSDQP